MYDSIIAYQLKMAKEFDKMSSEYNMIRIDGNLPIEKVNSVLQSRIDKLLGRV